jgi:hypothetical protein
MADTIQSVLVGGVAGFVSAVITYFSTRFKTRLELTAEYDKELQNNRLTTYKKLWGMLDKFARYGREGPVTYKVLCQVSNDTRNWYFHDGGIYLTRASRGPYFRLKQLMQDALDNKVLADHPDTVIEEKLLEPIIQAGSMLRTILSDDIGTKRASWLWGTGILAELTANMNAPD